MPILDVRDVTDLASAVDDDKNVSPPVHKHQVVDDAAFVVEQQAVALLAHGQIDYIYWHQAFKSGCGVWPDQAQLPHVRDVEKSCAGASVVVFGHQPGRVLHGHGIAGKWNHAGTQGNMQVVEGDF